MKERGPSLEAWGILPQSVFQEETRLPTLTRLKIAPSHSVPSLPMFPLEFRAEVNRQETRVMGLSSSEDRMS